MTTDRFTRLEAGVFSVYSDDDEAASRSYVRDCDLPVKARKALGSGTHRGVVLLKLGIDDYDLDAAHVDFHGSHWEGGAGSVLDRAIETLIVLRDQFEVMRSAPEARAQEHSAFTLGAEAQRAGKFPDGVPDLDTVRARQRATTR